MKEKIFESAHPRGANFIYKTITIFCIKEIEKEFYPDIKKSNYYFTDIDNNLTIAMHTEEELKFEKLSSERNYEIT